MYMSGQLLVQQKIGNNSGRKLGARDRWIDTIYLTTVKSSVLQVIYDKNKS